MLTTCPDCNQQVSTEAKKCPHCGRRIVMSGCGGCMMAFAISFVVLIGGCALLAVVGTLLPKKGAETQHSVTSSADFKQGYDEGKSMGLEWGSDGQNMPTPKGLEIIANGKSADVAASDREKWKLQFKSGCQDGFNEAKRTNRPATANASKYDQPSYWAGFKAGHDSAHIPLSQRPAMHQRCDDEIVANHYDKNSYNEGFVAGTAEADKEDPNWQVRP